MVHTIDSDLKGSGKHTSEISKPDILSEKAELADLVEKTRQIIGNISEWIIIYDTDLRYVEWNPFMESISWFKKEDVLGKHPSDLFPFLKDNWVIQNLENILIWGPKFENEFSYNVNDRRKSNINLETNRPLLDINWNIIWIIWMVQDLTESRKARTALQDSEYFFRESQEKAFIWSYRADFSTWMWQSSPVLDKIFWIDDKYIKNIEWWFDLIHQDDREMMVAYLNEEVIWNKKVFDKEYRITRKNDNITSWVHGLWEIVLDWTWKPVSLIWTIQDITERKKLQDKLSEAEYGYRILIENSQDIIFTLDPNGIFQFVSPSWENLIWSPLGDVEWHDLCQFIHPDDFNKCAVLLKRVIESWEIQDKIECRVRHADWSYRWFASTAIPIKDKTGKVILFEWIARDIHDGKMMEDTIVKTKLMYDNLVSKIPIWVYILHSNECGEFWLDFVSPKMAEILWLTVEDLIKNDKIIFDLIHPEDRESFAIKNIEWIELLRPFDWKGRFIVDWKIKWLHIASSPETINWWSVIWNWIVVDITDFKEKERESNIAKKQLIKINRTLKMMTEFNQLLINVETEQELLEMACKTIVKNWGYLMSWIGFIWKEDWKKITPVSQYWFKEWYLDTVNVTWDEADANWQWPTWRAIRERRPVFIWNIQNDPYFAPWREIAKDFWFNSLISLPLFVENEVIGTFLAYSKETEAFDEQELSMLNELALDISRGVQYIRAKEEKKKIDEALKRSEEQLLIRQRMDSLWTLAWWIWHDFNNLLTGMMWNLDMLNLDWTAEGKQKEYIANALKSCQRAADLVKQFQNLSNTAVTEKTSIDLHNIANEVFDLLKKTTDKIIEKRINFGEWDFHVLWSSSEIHQVLLNLWTNAYKALEERGLKDGDFISISAENYTASEDNSLGIWSWDYVHIIFEDNWRWMSEEVMRKAFDPLFTTRSKSWQRWQWLGLAMVYNIISRNHSWYIFPESKEGFGTKMHIYIPKAVVAEEQKKVEAKNQHEWTETILIIEDEKDIRDFVKEVLLHYWYNVLTADDWKEWLEVYTENMNKVDMVVLDLTMPKMSGQTVLEKMLEMNERVKVLISSGQSTEEMRDWILTRAKWYIHKPYLINELVQAIKKVLVIQ
jgi:PAS domain S-box-containing protein